MNSNTKMKIQLDLGNGLLLHTAQPENQEGILDLCQRCLDEREWAGLLIDGSHPTTGLEDWTVVEDMGTGKIVSTMCMIPQTWSYGSIPFGVARMDMVATEEPYRWKGLVRAQFRALEAESAARGDLLQVVVGRPYVYRRLGYSMALPYGVGTQVSRHGIPALKAGESEPFHVRPGTPVDLLYWTDLFIRDQKRVLVACQRSLAQWQHDFFERKIAQRLQLRIVEDARPGSNTFGQPIGGIVHAPDAADGLLYVFCLTMEAGVPWLEAAPSLLRYLEREGERYAAHDGNRWDGFWIGGEGHPILHVLTDFMQRIPPEGPFAWYVRLGSPAQFLLHIAAVIERRIETSAIVNWSGLIKLNFYEHETAGLIIILQNGRLVRAVDCHPSQYPEADQPCVNAAMPIEKFYSILFGYRSVDEVEAESAEVEMDGRSRAVLQAMFPKKPSRVFSVA